MDLKQFREEYKLAVHQMVNIGDIVEITFDHHKPYGDNPTEERLRKYHFQAKVTNIPAKNTDLIEFQRLDGWIDEMNVKHGIRNTCNKQHISRMVKRTTRPGKMEVYNGHPSYTKYRPQPGSRISEFSELFYNALWSYKTINLRKIDIPKALATWEKMGCPGLKREIKFKWSHGWIEVHWKTFKRWAHRHAPYFQYSVRECLEQAYRYEQEQYEEYSNDLGEDELFSERMIILRENDYSGEDENIDIPFSADDFGPLGNNGGTYTD